MPTDLQCEPDSSPMLAAAEGRPSRAPATEDEPQLLASEDWTEATLTLTESFPNAYLTSSATEGRREDERTLPKTEDQAEAALSLSVTEGGPNIEPTVPVAEGGHQSSPASPVTGGGHLAPPALPIADGGLLPDERFWCDHYAWLKDQGYVLRPRYRPGWVPIWAGTDAFFWNQEDGVVSDYGHIMDATRSSDGAIVMLKSISKKVHPYEVEVTQMFSSAPLMSNPRNHCVPLYDVLQVPDNSDRVLLVMPLLRRFYDPSMQTVGEAVDFFHQIFEGLQFMHENHVAHRDCMNFNIMMDPKPLFPKLFHPQKPKYTLDFKGYAKFFTRTKRPTKYYFIDFGLSRKYNPEDGPPREDPIWGGDKTVPEFHRSNDPCDPFPTDIYYLGNVIREDFLKTYRGVEFMQPLVHDMVDDDPAKRPTIDQVVTRFADLRGKLGYWKLRSRLVPWKEFWIMKIYRTIRHILRTIGYIVMNRPPVPTMISRNTPNESV
ncbi:uncharacterized protein LAESUDRAFT_672427 [Laetiporus sulphureus 93-53]|uniref:Protein kinase domain-containing protein n=1 Tax=Laetiporus sulphureus 93-53 TaxID=1314785 RepID=A0A165GVD2_9APHY|nr:uncharacterized protein LAESUDRAFT_672427 [Laetiporus sulphureus 93-53]KZT10870.1 hypothetical protein LAESUDRAFT_672427 [Laetiporus sulphureus 93-53]